MTQSLLDRIDALEAQIKESQNEIDELKGEISGKLDAGRVTDAADVTQPGWAADARQLNPSLDGTLAGKVSKIESFNNRSRIEHIWNGSVSGNGRITFAKDVSKMNWERLIVKANYAPTNIMWSFGIDRIMELANTNLNFHLVGIGGYLNVVPAIRAQNAINVGFSEDAVKSGLAVTDVYAVLF